MHNAPVSFSFVSNQSAAMSSSSAKRRKVSVDNTAPNVVPSAVLFIPATVTAAAVTRLQPNLSEIAELVLVDLQKDNPQDVEDALDALADALPSSEEEWGKEECKKKGKELSHTGAAAMVVLTMQKWPTHREIQVCGSACLAALTGNEEDTTPSVSVVVSGGVETVINALKAFPNHEHILFQGLRALRNIFCDVEASPILQSRRRFVNEYDGIALVQKAMKELADDEEVQLECCAVLYNLAAEKEFHEALTKAGAMVEVGTALRDHPENEDIQECGKDFMKKIFG